MLESRGVEARTGTLVERASPDGVLLVDGREIPARTVVWSAGIRATQLAGTDGLPQTRSRRLAADQHLRVAGYPHVFAVGDLASVRIDGRELPMLSAPAMHEGCYVAQAILASLRGRELRQQFRYRDKSTMALIGRNATARLRKPIRQ